MSLTLEAIEKQLNLLSQEVHNRDINFIMLEVPKEPSTANIDDKLRNALEHRRQFLFENQFEKQDDIDYIHPNQNQKETPQKVDLFIKANIELTKDIYGTSVKSNYILKYCKWHFKRNYLPSPKRNEFKIVCLKHLEINIKKR